MPEAAQASSWSAADELRAALAQIEKILARHKPEEVSDQCSRAASHLICLRDHLIEDEGRAREAPPLARINSLLSALAGVEFPMAGTHWKRVEQVRDGLRQMLQA